MNRIGPLGLLSVSLAVTVASAADLAECVGIKDDAVRLFCYDRAAGRTPTSMETSGSPAVASPTAAGVPAPAASVPAEAPTRVESRIVGGFDGWRQGTKFKLENGQTWEAIGTSTFNTRTMDAPSVLLERDFIGQMKLSVDGVKPRAAVRIVNGG